MKKFSLLLLVFLNLHSLIFAQRNLDNSITGKVLDKDAKVPLEYSNIILFSQRDSSQSNGTVTNAEGIFNITSIRPGEYYIKVSFIGYESSVIKDIKITPTTNLDLGEILIKAEGFNTEDVIVSGERSAISYQIDKKVINVSEQLTSISGNAVDVLENVPSVTVDIEGNVSLRGSSNFTVLIDGKPTILESNEALQNIPASTIENIEIITNPSAKYNPEGTAGIINILTKKNSLEGISGIANLNGGSGTRYGADAVFELKNDPINFSLGLDYSKHLMEGESISDSWTLFNQNKYYNSSNGNGNHGRENYGIKSSLAYSLSDNDVITLNGRFGYRDGTNKSTLSYSQWNDINPSEFNYTTISDRARNGYFYSTGLNYSRNFDSKNHTLSADLIFQKNNSDEFTSYKQFDINKFIVQGQEQTEKGPSSSVEIKVDYSYPITAESKFEAGYNSEFDISDEMNEYFLFDSLSSSFKLENLFSKDVSYDNNVHALYSMYSNQFDNLGFQFGLRGEFTDRLIKLNNTDESFAINRWDFFPSLHLSYKLNEKNQFMTSYTRRIQRPRGWELEPFLTWMDSYNVRQGNPALEPENIDSYELGYQRMFDKSLFSAELYYRVNNNKIESYQTAYSENVTLRSMDNVGKDYSFGSELMLNFDPIKIWNVNLMGNLYNYKIVGQLNETDFDRESFNWNTRLNNSLNISQNSQLQFNLFYNSPTVSAQGKNEDFIMASAAFRQMFMDKQIALTLQVRDIFATGKREFTSESFDFYRYNKFVMESPVVMLNLRFNFNNYKSQNRSEREGSGMEVEGGDDF
ncbi:MAG: TonB-dependent receptor [Ignavibacteriae bacterium]|nr:TonB-dependent receptor [Ignavibacteriota bacterium]